MITHIQGKLVEKNPAYAVIDCNGVGYFLHISVNTYSKMGDKEHCKLFTHLSVREDAHTLYGFADADEREMFRNLISVSGVGASTARMILSSLTPVEVRNAILTDNVTTLKSIKGIGGKSAQRIIVDLKDRLGKSEVGMDILSLANNTIKKEALSALVTLGFDRGKSDQILEKMLSELGENVAVEELIRVTIKKLS